MFWEIKINDEDQRYHGVIYKGNTYVFTRICFGNKPSPPIAELCMIKIAIFGRESHPTASKVLIHKRYMDDIVDAHSDESELQITRDQIDNLIGKFGFEIKAWYSNRESLGCCVDEKKVLGVKWKMTIDKLVPSTGSSKSKGLTKRKVLS